MAKTKYAARAIYNDGRVIDGKHHKDARRCYEELKIMLRKLNTEGLSFIGVTRVIEVEEKNEAKS